MEWLQQIFDGPNHEALEWKYHGKDVRSQDEKEDIDRAIRESLLEERKGKRVIDNEFHLEEDEHLARALQESLNINESPRQHDYENIIQPYSFPSFTGFICHACNLPISNNEYVMYENYRYHNSCYNDHSHPKCDVCNNFFATKASKYRVHPFWDQKSCYHHDYDGTPRCSSCERLESRNTHYTFLEDGRKFCQECLETAIMSTEECLPLYFDIQEFFEGLNMKVEQQVPLHLVDRHALNEVEKGEKSAPELIGLCMSETRDVNSVVRSSRIMEAFRIKIMKTNPYKLKCKWEVTVIMVLFGFPRLLTGSILAHELMHAWLNLEGYSTVSRDVKEGICQVLAHMWLESEIKSGSGNTSSSSSSKMDRHSKFEKNFGEFCKRNIENDRSKDYGDGFRAANRAVNKYGLRTTLAHIGKTGSFPH
ncbi:hypothetical protein HHK36_020161 [Tetracentron sinense]|uniref:Protein DA1-like domain-containing protein n=1 Tax=Tetracentron sinense TaxID=13715 RepID=A0A834YR67_TETSI|nr:hypothetical protein HHK36_020161 [Tetracentron sinense]